LIKGGIVLINPESSAIEKIIALQYNPDTLTRSLQVKGIGGDSNNRSEALRLTGPPVETLKIDAEIDATDQMEVAESVTRSVGIQPQLAVLETIVYPKSSRLIANNNAAQSGVLEILPVESPLTLFVWNKNRIVPVRITDLSITEEAFDVNLNPLRAKVSLGMRVLSVDDLGFSHKGGGLFMIYHQGKERLAGMFKSGSLGDLGLSSIG
jgi:hypothetical protein